MCIRDRVKTAPTSEISIQEVIAYISAEGGDLTYKGNSAAIAQNEELFRVEHLSVGSSVHDVSFGCLLYTSRCV